MPHPGSHLCVFESTVGHRGYELGHWALAVEPWVN